LLKQYDLAPGEFLCAIPRLRWTPYWEIHPDTVKPNAERIAENEKFAELDHAKLREGIIAWVRGTKRRVLLAPECRRCCCASRRTRERAACGMT